MARAAGEEAGRATSVVRLLTPYARNGASHVAGKTKRPTVSEQQCKLTSLSRNGRTSP